MARRREARFHKRPPYEIAKRKTKKGHEEWLKRVSKKLEHDKELEVAILRLEKLSHHELAARQTKFLRGIVAGGKSQQVLMHVAAMTPEQFREFIISKLMHHHS